MKRLIKEFTAGNAMLSVLAVVASFIVGGILIAVSSEDVQTTLGYITARPSDFFNALWNAVFGAYDAMFRGAIFNYKATNFVQMIKPITETLAYATPITMAGLGLAVAFLGWHICRVAFLPALPDSSARRHHRRWPPRCSSWSPEGNHRR